MAVKVGEVVRVGGADLGVVVSVNVDDEEINVRTFDVRTNTHYTLSYCKEDVTSI